MRFHCFALLFVAFALPAAAQEPAEIDTPLRAIKPAHEGGQWCAALSGDGKTILSGGYRDGLVSLWDATTGKKILNFAGHMGVVLSVDLSPDGRWGLSCGNDQTMRLWDLESGQEVYRFQGHASRVRVVRFLPGGRQVLAACDNGTILLYDRKSGEVLRTIKGHADYIPGLAVSADGKRAVTCSADRSVKVWDLEKGAEVRRFQHADTVQHVALTPDGKHAVSTSMDNTVRVWDVDAGKEVRRLAHPGMVWSLAIAPDGRRVYTGGGGGPAVKNVIARPDNVNPHVRVFDLHTGRELCVLKGHTSWVQALGVSLDGRLLVSAGMDGSIRLWGPR